MIEHFSPGAQRIGRDQTIDLIGPAEDSLRIVRSERIARAYGLHSINAEVLAARGFKPGARLKKYLEPSIEGEMGDPLRLKNVDKSFELSLDALRSGKNISIFCDFDVDGITAAWEQQMLLSVMRDALRSQSKIEVIASRRMSGGYGVDLQVARRTAKERGGLFITLDMGTQQGAMLRDLEQEYGIKTLVIDHHSPGREDVVPPVMVNPRQRGEKIKYRNLSAGGLVYVQKKSFERLLARERKPWARQVLRALKALEPDFAVFATLSTVADVMPLNGFNRALVRAGLVFLTQMAAIPDERLLSQQWQRRALAGLLQACGLRHKDLVSQDIGFKVGPVLNALGRLMDEGAQRAVDFFMFPDLRVVESAVAFVAHNEVRKRTEAEAVRRTLEKCGEEFMAAGIPYAVVAAMDEIHPGVQGIVAARVRDNYFRPAGVGTYSPDRRTISFSWRGIRLKDGSDVSIKEAFEHPALKAILERPGNKGGGHAAAGGCTIRAEELEEFKAAAQAAFAAQMEGKDIGRFFPYDRLSSLAEILAGGVAMVRQQRKIFNPCGKDNPEPLHRLRNLRVMAVTEAGGRSGATGHLKHWILKLKEDAGAEGGQPSYINGMLWFTGQDNLPKIGSRLDVVAELGIDDHKAPHNEALQTVVLDIKHLTLL